MLLLIGSGGWLGMSIAGVVFLTIAFLIFLWLKSVLRPKPSYPPLKNNPHQCREIVITCPVCSLVYSDSSYTNCLKDGAPLIKGTRRCF